MNEEDVKNEGTVARGVPRGLVEGHPAVHSGAAMRAILDHFQQA